MDEAKKKETPKLIIAQFLSYSSVVFNLHRATLELHVSQ